MRLGRYQQTTVNTMTLRLAKQQSIFLAIALCVLVGVACGEHDGPKMHLLGPQANDAYNAEHERLHKMQMVRVLKQTPGPDGGIQTTIVEREPVTVMNDLGAQCRVEINATSTIDGVEACPLVSTGSGPRWDCFHYDLCNILELSCAAQRALEIVSTRAAPFVVDAPEFDEHVHYSIPPQSSATNAALAKQAAASARETFFFQRTLQGAFAPLDGSNHINCDPNALSTSVINPSDLFQPTRTVASVLSNAFAEAYQVLREATSKAVDFSLAVADAQRADTSLERQQSRSIAGAELSRTAAAHLLVGGDPGLLGSEGAESRPGLCSAPELSGPAKKALSAFRESGISPAAILTIPGETNATPIPIDMLVNGTGTQVPGGSVRQRLSEVWGYDFINPPPGIKPDQHVETYLHLDKQDFVEARSYLAQEIRSFSRSLTAKFDPVIPEGAKPSGVCGTPVDGGVSNDSLSTAAGFCRHFASTARTPKLRPDSYYTTLVRHTTPRPMASRWAFPRGLPDMEEMMNYADRVDGSLALAGNLLANEGAITNTQLRSEIMNPIATLLAAKERPARLSICGEVDDDSFAVVDGYAPSDQLRLVRGEDGLSCAVEGSVEGVRCDNPSNPGLLDPKFVLNAFSFAYTPALGFSQATAFDFEIPGEDDHTRIYLVRRKPGFSTDAPGAFDPDRPRGGAASCQHHAAEPQVVYVAATELRRNGRRCTHAARERAVQRRQRRGIVLEALSSSRQASRRRSRRARGEVPTGRLRSRSAPGDGRAS